MSDEYIESLQIEQIKHLSKKMRDDLRAAHDLLNQTPKNSSRPPGSMPIWEKGETGSSDEQPEPASGPEPESEPSLEMENAGEGNNSEEGNRKAGKQPGAQGYGRTVTLPLTSEPVLHRPENCPCGKKIGEDAPFEVKYGYHVLDIVQEGLGIRVTHELHLYGESPCECGHINQTHPGRCQSEDLWEKVELTEWRLIGGNPLGALASFIICLSLRMRQSRARVQEFLASWLGIELSTGCIHQCIVEGGRATEPLEQEMIEAIQASGLVNVDETGWRQRGHTMWLWVMTTATVTLYLIGSRSWDVIAHVMESYAGWLMSDGYGQYRKYGNRLRCWAHLIRKARGLAESCAPDAVSFGTQVLEAFTHFIKGIHQARGSPDETLPSLQDLFSDDLTQLKQLCEQHRNHTHTKLRQLARELLNDWVAIWTVLEHPHFPLTNNDAERALRHWVISRKLSYGTRSAQGSRAFALLASVIDTCRQRGVSPWPFLAQVISQRRQGLDCPPLPS